MSSIRRCLAIVLAIAGFLQATGPALADGAQSEAVSPTSFEEFDKRIEQTKSAMMGDPQQALATARSAVALARRLPPSPRAQIALATAKWLEGEALIGTNDRIAAAPIIAEALAITERSAPDTKLHGDLLRSHGAIASMGGQVVAALTAYQHAFRVFEKARINRSQALVLQDIGQIYADAGDYDKVLKYYGQAIDTYAIDPALNMTTHNNRAEIYRKQKRYALASREYHLALEEVRKLDSPLLQVRILTNLAGSETEGGHFSAARTAVDQAMALARHGDAAGWRPFVFGAAANLAAARGDSGAAAVLFDQTFAGIDLSHSEMLFRDYHLAASRTYEALGDRSLALDHFKAFQRLDSEARNLTASIASQLASAQFDFATQNLKIAQLKQEKLEKDIAARTVLFGVAGSAAAIIFGVLLGGFLSVRRSRNEVRAANDCLSVSNAQLEKALHAKTEFLAMTSHEIRTPLNGILGMTQVLLADRRIADDLRSRIEVVNSAGETMRALVDDILDVAKMESGELTIAHEQTDLAAILKETEQLWSGQAQVRGVALRLDTVNAPAQIIGDGGRIRQIIFNLMSNALKFTPQGSVVLKVAADRRDDGNERLVIDVIDTGIGIPADMHEAIFESFKQADSGTTRQFSGTGLGLAICKRLAEAMDGTISVESVVGEGSTFRVDLPLKLPADQPNSGEPAQQSASLSDKGMAVALPDGEGSVLLKMALMSEAASLEITSSLEAARAVLEREAIDHLLFDVACLPADCSNPTDALRELVETCDAAGTKLSLMLAREGPISPAQAMMIGAAQIIIKPINLDALLSALRSVHAEDPEVFVAPELLEAAG